MKEFLSPPREKGSLSLDKPEPSLTCFSIVRIEFMFLMT